MLTSVDNLHSGDASKFNVTIVTVSAFDQHRLQITLKSLLELPSNLEHITVVPKTDLESIATWKRICGKKTTKNFRLLFDSGTGIYPAMNLGLQASSGSYVCFWNAGETSVGPNSLKVLSAYAASCTREVFLVGADLEWDPLYDITQQSLRNFVLQSSSSFISHHSIFLRRDVAYNFGGFNERYVVAADTDLIYRILNRFTPSILEEKIVRVERPAFAKLHNRRARFESLLVASSNLTGVMKLMALWNIFKRELRNFLLSDTLRIFVPNLNRDTVSLEPNLVREFQKKYPSNFMRSLLVSLFSQEVLKTKSAGSVLKVACIGGYQNEPEIDCLKYLGFSVEVDFYGIEEGMNFLDLNRPYKIPNPKIRYDLILCSQVLEHIWNHSQAFKNLTLLSTEGTFLWLSCPTSNRAHGSPDYYSAGFTSSYLTMNLANNGFSSKSSGHLGTRRNYLITHMAEVWPTVHGHNRPLFSLYRGRRVSVWVAATIWKFFSSLYFCFQNGRLTSQQRYATESWVYAEYQPKRINEN